jgi:N-acyl-D-amino-acid deacylase
MKWTIPTTGALLLAATIAVPAAADSASASGCLVVTGARVADGSGKPLVSSAVRVCGDTIRDAGPRVKAWKGERTLDGRGLVLAPGFIDVHNHSTGGLKTDPDAASQVSQGITTLVIGADGESPFPIREYLEARRTAPAAVNVMAMVGHATVRQKIMGDDFKRAATPDEVEKMAALVDTEMRDGASGLSSGLEYEVGSWSTTDELVGLARAAAKHGGFYMTHTRDEADKSMDAFAEAIAISERAGLPLQISHIKLGTTGVWGKSAEVFRMVAAAKKRGVDVTADCYPYEAWHANIEVIVPDKKYDDPASVKLGLDVLGGADRITITGCRAHHEWEGKNLAEIAKAEGTTPVALFSRIVKEGGADVIGHSMREEDVLAFYRQPWVMVASDGGIGSEHPRGTGTFPRVLGRFVCEKKLFPLEEAVRKMTSMPAKRMKLADRGTIRPGAKADLVLFDPKTVIDRSTFEKPAELSEGIRYVLVNGELVWEDGKGTGKRPGRVLAPGR